MNTSTLWNFVTSVYEPRTGTYRYSFSFTDKPSYLEFRRLWRSAYAEATLHARTWRQARQRYRDAGGFRQELFQLGTYPKPECSVAPNLPVVTQAFQAIPVPADRKVRRALCEVRAASKKEAGRQRALALEQRPAA